MPKLSLENKVSFSFLSLLFFFGSIVQFFASKKPAIKKTKKIDAVALAKYFDKIVSKGPVRESNPGPLAP